MNIDLDLSDSEDKRKSSPAGSFEISLNSEDEADDISPDIKLEEPIACDPPTVADDIFLEIEV